MGQRGFTLLEVMVATVIMGIAVVGLMSGISHSLRNADRVTDYDRAALLARSKMDDLLVNYQLPRGPVVSGAFDPVLLGGKEGGWRARVTIFEGPPRTIAGAEILERIELEIWWQAGAGRRRFNLEAFRSKVVRPGDADLAPAGLPQ
jgi:general secretion pathway protein I